MKNNYDIIVIGAGPSGSTAALYSALKGVSVLVLEKDRDIGIPVRCAEAVNKNSLMEFIEPDKKWISSEINSLTLVSPAGKEIIINIEIPGLILERKVFDLKLAEMATDAGAEYITKAFVYDLLREGNNITGVKYEKNGEKFEARGKIIIGADGVESRVGRFAGINSYTRIQDMESCVQMQAGNIKGLNTSTIYFYFGRNCAPGGYLWVFPKGENKANIGLGISGDQSKKRAPVHYLNDFMKEKYPDYSQLSFVCGGVPCATTRKEIVKDNVMLIGDAAHQVNPLSGGGIVSGMVAGKIAGNYAADTVLNNDMSRLKNYPKEWYERLGKKYESFYKVKNFIYIFDDNRLNSIAASMEKVPVEERSLKQVFSIALKENPGMILDVLKYFLIKQM